MSAATPIKATAPNKNPSKEIPREVELLDEVGERSLKLFKREIFPEIVLQFPGASGETHRAELFRRFSELPAAKREALDKRARAKLDKKRARKDGKESNPASSNKKAAVEVIDLDFDEDRDFPPLDPVYPSASKSSKSKPHPSVFIDLVDDDDDDDVVIGKHLRSKTNIQNSSPNKIISE